MSSLKGLYYPFGIVQGETFNFSFEFIIDGTTQLYTDYDFIGQLKEQGNIMVVAAMTFTQNPQNSNLVDVTIPSASTIYTSPKTYLYEVRCTHKVTGEVKTLLYGDFKIAKTYSQTMS